MLTDSNALHPENKLSLISVRFCGKIILTSEEQLWKAQPPMLTTCSPIAILVAFEQEAKALFDMNTVFELTSADIGANTIGVWGGVENMTIEISAVVNIFEL